MTIANLHQVVLPYADIPGFPVSTAPGHQVHGGVGDISNCGVCGVKDGDVGEVFGCGLAFSPRANSSLDVSVG